MQSFLNSWLCQRALYPASDTRQRLVPRPDVVHCDKDSCGLHVAKVACCTLGLLLVGVHTFLPPPLLPRLLLLAGGQRQQGMLGSHEARVEGRAGHWHALLIHTDRAEAGTALQPPAQPHIRLTGPTAGLNPCLAQSRVRSACPSFSVQLSACHPPVGQFQASA